MDKCSVSRFDDGELDVGRSDDGYAYARSLDGPCRADEKARPASGFVLRTVRSPIPAHAGHTRSGPETANFLLITDFHPAYVKRKSKEFDGIINRINGNIKFIINN